MIKQTIKNALADGLTRYRHWRGVKGEIRKFRDPRRVKIANEYTLTIEQKEQIDDLYLKNYGEKIGYVWHQNYAAHAGKFDCHFFPEHLYIPEFESYQNTNRAAVSMMSDKNFIPLIAKAKGVRMPDTIVSCTAGIFRDSEEHIITEKQANELLHREEDVFCKPSVDTCSGQGCYKIKGNVCSLHGQMLSVGNHTIGGEAVRELKSDTSESFDLKAISEIAIENEAFSSKNSLKNAVEYRDNFQSVSSRHLENEFSDGLGG